MIKKREKEHMKSNTYNTAGRRALIEFFAQNPDRQFTAEELCMAVNGDKTTGMSSIYRHLRELCESEVLRKFRDDTDNRSVYQYVGKGSDCDSHFHEKCLRCGALRHLDCDDSIAFAAHLLAVHGFQVDRGQSILYGVCASCRARGEGR